MDIQTTERLVKLNSRFYAKYADSFSKTRQAPWEGWKRCAELAGLSRLEDGARLRITDIACGNMRFERFLADRFPSLCAEYTLIDNCMELAGVSTNGARLTGAPKGGARFQNLDIASLLLREDDSLNLPKQQDLIVCFGFFHHLPLEQMRIRLLKEMIMSLAPKGTGIVSLWRFADDERMRGRAKQSSKAGCEELGLSLDDEGDFLLGWQNRPDAYRYCHSFSLSEIDALALSLKKDPRGCSVERFDADLSNTYLVFRREPGSQTR